MRGDTRSFKAESKTINDFTRDWGPSAYLIPDFQRRYVWKTDQLTDFLASVVDSDSGYYIGPLVIVRPEETSHDIEIIDGQQRLTSITISIKVLHDLIISRKIEVNSDLQAFINLFLYRESKPRMHFRDEFFDNHFRMLLVHEDPLSVKSVQEWFRNMKSETEKLTSAGATKARQKLISRKAITRLFSTYKDIQKYFEKSSEVDWVKALEKFMRLQVIEIMCQDISVVNSLFEGLNSKGIQLTNAELIKNKLYGHIDSLGIPPGDAVSIKDLWSEMDDNFYIQADERMIDKFLRHNWISLYGHISGAALYKKYSDKIKDLDETNLKGFVVDLNKFGDYYVAIKNMKFSNETLGLALDPSVYAAFNEFGRLNNDQVYEVLLALIRLVKDDELREVATTKDLRLILAKLWNFCFRIQFILVRTSRYEHIFADLAQKLTEWAKGDKPLATLAINFIDEKLKPLVSDSDQFIENLSSQLVYKDSTQSRWLLEKVFYDVFSNYEGADKYDSSYQYRKPTIEHILPQKPAKWGYKLNEVRDIVNDIGNLTLLDANENNGADDDLFEKKVENIYSRSPYKFNRDIGNDRNFSSGNIAELTNTINDRSRKIAISLEQFYSL